MMLRRYFCLCLCALLAAVLGWCASEQPSLEFIQLTDTHLTNLAGAEARVASAREHFAPSTRSMAAFFARSGLKYCPSVYLITGDLTDAFRYEGANREPVYGQVENFVRVAAGSAAPVDLALGNHDIQHYAVNLAGKLQADQSVAGEARAAWIASAKCFVKGTYYSLEKTVGRTSYLFLVLDNAYNSGAMAAEQLHWLRRQVERQGDRNLVLAMHIPLGGDANSAAIKGALAGARVTLVLAGHKHSDAVEEIAAGVGPVVQVRTAAFGYGENNWRRIRLREDAIDVFATGTPERLEKTMSRPSPPRRHGNCRYPRKPSRLPDG